MDKILPQENRKQRRRRLAISRRGKRDWRMGSGKHAAGGNKFKHIHVSWHQRIIKEMKDCPTVVNNVLSGKLDWVLKAAR